MPIDLNTLRAEVLDSAAEVVMPGTDLAALLTDWVADKERHDELRGEFEQYRELTAGTLKQLWAAQEEQRKLKEQLRDEMGRLVRDGDVEREVANEVLSGFGIPDLPHKYEATVTVTFRIGGLTAWDGREIDDFNIEDAFRPRLIQNEGFTVAGVEVQNIDLDDLDEA
ncbi:hypothetical protein AB0G73_10715 [Streptomyces sp. NPDC020719]|uniref:hypothetical protein n=1 Tax=Streptomyces sp. NPDC020719 TaxID=3154896 RepID=UPI0034045F99